MRTTDQEYDESTMALLGTTNALKWAEEFVRLHGGDTGLMLAWFANAIETGRRAGSGELTE